MKLTKLAVVGLAVLLVTAGAAAAMPGNAPADAGDDAQADDHRQDDDRRSDDANASDARPDDAGNASDAGAADDARSAASNADERGADVEDRGPPVDLPGAVPDHVSAIHDLVRSHLDGGIDGSLGEAIADVTPDEADAET